MKHAIPVDPRALRAWPFLPPTAPPGSWWLGPTGEVVRVDPDGSAVSLAAPGHPRPGIAADPTAGSAAP